MEEEFGGEVEEGGGVGWGRNGHWVLLGCVLELGEKWRGGGKECDG